MKKEGFSDIGVEKLIVAIIKLAVKDYMRLYNSFIKNPNIDAAQHLIVQRRYFESDCGGLTYCGETIVKMAENTVREKYSDELLYAADCIYNGKLANCV